MNPCFQSLLLVMRIRTEKMRTHKKDMFPSKNPWSNGLTATEPWSSLIDYIWRDFSWSTSRHSDVWNNFPTELLVFTDINISSRMFVFMQSSYEHLRMFDRTKVNPSGKLTFKSNNTACCTTTCFHPILPQRVIEFCHSQTIIIIVIFTPEHRNKPDIFFFFLWLKPWT